MAEGKKEPIAHPLAARDRKQLPDYYN